MAGQVIFLNGSSSAGKTTLAKALQDRLAEPWFHIALDQFRDGMPGRYRGMNAPVGAPGYEGLNVVPIQQGGKRVTDIRMGKVGQSMLRGMHQAISAFADVGNNVIIDDLIMQPETLTDYVLKLAHHWVLFVAVRCTLEVVIEREIKRSGRFPGTAESHYDRVHAHNCYDLEVDTSTTTPAACAEVIARYIEQGNEPLAWPKLRENMANEHLS